MAVGSGSPDYSLSYISDRLTIAVLGGIWHDIRTQTDVNDNVIYRGVHEVHNVSEDDPDWEIWKLSWSGKINTRIQGPLKGAWSNRSFLKWEYEYPETVYPEISTSSEQSRIIGLLEEILMELRSIRLR